ncbi:hypothetical protein [Halomonas sp. BC04]|uniref:hypothetical protein n=1 Tax=Halomonas sp. BC04 TaxID=1403540 RepID=UPI0004B22252|nr:hypothetical protein [Halomonas sp. BC04]
MLQQKVFPFFEGLSYLGRPYGKDHFIESISWTRSKKILISSETYPGRLLDSYSAGVSYLEVQLEGIERLLTIIPNSSIVIGVREHESWILSCYKHYIKYGGTLSLEEFFSLSGEGLMSPDEFLIWPRVKLLDEMTDGRVFVYFLEDFTSSPGSVVRGLERFFQSDYTGNLLFGKENEGVNRSQAEVVRQVNNWIFKNVKKSKMQKLLTKKSYSFIKKFISTRGEPLSYDSDASSAILKHYEDDLRKLSIRVTRQSPCA